MLNKTNLPPEQDQSAPGKLVQAVGHAAGSSTAVGMSNVIAFPAQAPHRGVHEDFTFVELPPGRYAGTVEKVRFILRATTHIVITYKLDTPDGIRRVQEMMLIKAPRSWVSAFSTTKGLGRVEDILRIGGLTLADVDGLKALPKLIEGIALGVITRNQRTGEYNAPVVVRVEHA